MHLSTALPSLRHSASSAGSKLPVLFASSPTPLDSGYLSFRRLLQTPSADLHAAVLSAHWLRQSRRDQAGQSGRRAGCSGRLEVALELSEHGLLPRARCPRELRNEQCLPGECMTLPLEFLVYCGRALHDAVRQRMITQYASLPAPRLLFYSPKSTLPPSRNGVRDLPYLRIRAAPLVQPRRTRSS